MIFQGRWAIAREEGLGGGWEGVWSGTSWSSTVRTALISTPHEDNVIQASPMLYPLECDRLRSPAEGRQSSWVHNLLSTPQYILGRRDGFGKGLLRSDMALGTGGCPAAAPNLERHDRHDHSIFKDIRRYLQ